MNISVELGRYEKTRRVALKGQLPGMTGAVSEEKGALEGSFGLGRKGRSEGRVGMSSRGRILEREHTSVGMAGVSDSPPTSCSLGLWGRWSAGATVTPAEITGVWGGACWKEPLPCLAGSATSSALPCSCSFGSQLCPSGGGNRCTPIASRADWLWVGLLHKNQVSCREIERLVFYKFFPIPIVF